MANFKIKEPRTKNINLVVQTYNRKKGQGIEIFYDIKKGRLFLAEYYKSYSDGQTRKISAVVGDVHLPEISPEYLSEEVKRVKQNEIAARIAEEKHREEQLQRYRAQRKAHHLRKLGLKK